MTTLDFGQCLVWNWASRARELSTAIKYSRDFSSGFQLTIYELIQIEIIFRQKSGWHNIEISWHHTRFHKCAACAVSTMIYLGRPHLHNLCANLQFSMRWNWIVSFNARAIKFARDSMRWMVTKTCLLLTKISLDVSHFPYETFTQIYFYKHFWVNARTFGVKSTFQLDGRTVSAFKRSLGIKTSNNLPCCVGRVVVWIEHFLRT